MADLSVIIPSYNSSAFIAATLDSVLAQTDRPAQVVVIDDGSTDESPGIIQAYADRFPGLVELVRQANAGESRARNVGIARARGRFIAFLDADDLWLPEKTARQVELLAREADAVAVHTRVFNFQNVPDDLGRPETEKTKDDPSVEDLIAYHYVCPSALVVRAQTLGAGGICFDEAVRHAEDMLFIADLRLAGRLRLADEALTAKRVHAGQQSRNPLHTIHTTQSRMAWCRKHAQALGAERAARMEAELGGKLLDWLERRYWRRDLDRFDELRALVAQTAPDQFRASAIAQRKIHPRWVYRVVDAFAPPRPTGR